MFYPLYSNPKCLYASAVAFLPRGVLAKNPICIKYGSYTSSIVATSSFTVAANVSSPTGPPLYFSIIAICRIPFNEIIMPISLLIYILTLIICVCKFKKDEK